MPALWWLIVTDREVISVQRVRLAKFVVVWSATKLYDWKHSLVAVLAKAMLSERSELWIWPSEARHQIRGIKRGLSPLF